MCKTGPNAMYIFRLSRSNYSASLRVPIFSPHNCPPNTPLTTVSWCVWFRTQKVRAEIRWLTSFQHKCQSSHVFRSSLQLPAPLYASSIYCDLKFCRLFEYIHIFGRLKLLECLPTHLCNFLLSLIVLSISCKFSSSLLLIPFLGLFLV